MIARRASEVWRLWAGLLAAPLAWAAQFVTIYALVLSTGRWPLHLVTALGLAAALAGLGVAWRNARAAGSGPTTEPPPAGTTRLMAVAGLMAGALFSAAIVAQWVAVLLLDPSPRADP